MAQLDDILREKCAGDDLKKLEDYSYHVNNRTVPLNNFGIAGHVAPMWWIREALREQFKVYPQPTSAILQLRAMFPETFLHISKEDPLMVAYTPDSASGLADRQVKTTLGRYLQKFHFRINDKEAKEIVYKHLAEADPTIEYVEGDALVEVYKSGAFGTCMSGSSKVWSYNPKGMHPANAYKAAGIKLAVMRDSEGTVKERALVVTKPNGTVGYIRVYGTKLQKKLQRADIKTTGWVGIEFNTIAFQSGDAEPIEGPLTVGQEYSLVLPYLDCNGAAGSSGGSCVALLDGKLTGVSYAQYNVLRSEYGDLAAICATNTSGYIRLKNVQATDLYGVCPLTGIKFDKASSSDWTYYINGLMEVQAVAIAAVRSLRQVSAMVNGALRSVRIHADVPTFTHTYHECVESDDLRAYWGYVKLDAAKYPDRANEWFMRDSTTLMDEGSENAYRVLLSDITEVISRTEGGYAIRTYLWKPARKELKGYIKLHPLHAGHKFYAAPSAADLVLTTLSGKKVTREYHNVFTVARNPANMELARLCSRTNYLGNTVYVPKRTELTAEQKAWMDNQWLETNFDDWIDTPTETSTDEEYATFFDEISLGWNTVNDTIYRFIRKIGTYTWNRGYAMPNQNVDLTTDVLEGRTFIDNPAVKLWLERKKVQFALVEARRVPVVVAEPAAEEATQLPALPETIELAPEVTQALAMPVEDTVQPVADYI